MRTVYGIEMTYNNEDPVAQFSPDRGGVSVHLYNTDDGALAFKALRSDTGMSERWWLKSIQAGDTLTFSYLQPDVAPDTTMQRIESYNNSANTPQIAAPGERLCVDVAWRDQPTLRCAYPDQGGLSFILTNAPVVTARAFVMAGNTHESWSWEFADLQPNELCRVTVGFSDWWDPPHRTVKK